MDSPQWYSWIVLAIVTFYSLSLARSAVQIKVEVDLGGDIDLSPSFNAARSCTINNTVGVCIKYSQCLDNGTFDRWGTFHDDEIRSADCPGDQDWCCLADRVTSDPTQRNTSSVAEIPVEKINDTMVTDTGVKNKNGELTCRPAPLNACPWCVPVFRDGGSPYSKGPGGRYCIASIVGDGGAILTAASCLKAALNQVFWIEYAGQNYTSQSEAIHPRYNSGSRGFDIAVVTLNDIPKDKARGCFVPAAFVTSTDCRAVGFTKEGEIVLTTVTVTEGRCNDRGEAAGALCARAEDPDTCRVALGSPLLCPLPAGGWGIRGVSRGGGCRDGATYSSIVEEQTFLNQLLPPTVPEGLASTDIRKTEQIV